MTSQDEKERIARAVRAFQRGIDREQSFRILFDRYHDVVHGFFAHRVCSPEDRLDLTQETFLRVYKGLESYRREAEFGTWLFRIAYNTYLKWLRRRKGESWNLQLAPPAGGDSPRITWEGDQPVAVSRQPTPLDDTLEHERQRELREAIGDLPEQMRRCTELRVFQELSYREIAAVMRLSIETVKVHLFQARKKLKGALRETFAEVDL